MSKLVSPLVSINHLMQPLTFNQYWGVGVGQTFKHFLNGLHFNHFGNCIDN